MHKNILIPVDLDHGHDPTNKIEIARRLLAEDGQMTLLGVVERLPSYVAEYITVEPVTKIVPKIKAQLEKIAEGHDDISCAVVSGAPGLSIVQYAEKTGADLIVVGSRKPGAQEYFLGSTASRVVRRAPCAVLVLR